MSEFEKKYITSNNRKDLPEYDEAFVAKLRERILTRSPELRGISEPLLAALAIGAHRPDIVPHLLQRALEQAANDDEVRERIVYAFKSVMIVVWPFVGIPWCIPAGLGMVHVLEKLGFVGYYGNSGLTRPELGAEHEKMGLELLEKTYANVPNSEVREMLRENFPDFTKVTWAVVFGYSLAGTTATGIFDEKQTQLLLTAAIASSGATRQARSHLKASVGLGNSLNAADAVNEAAVALNAWNGVEIANVDVSSL